MSLTLLLMLVGCGLDDIEPKYGDTGRTETVDPDPVDNGGGGEDGGDETAGATTGGATTGGATTGGATTGGATTGGATTGGATTGGDATGGDATGGDATGGTSGAEGTGGGAGPCPEATFEDCSGECASLDDLRLRVGDGICDTTFPNWNCGSYAYDGGDCDSVSDTAAPADATGGDPTGGDTTDTGTAEVGYPVVPGGDCERFDGTIGVYDCTAEQCRPSWWLGDGFCDDSLGMACEETGWDGDDCSPPSEEVVCYDVEDAAGVYVVDPSEATLYTDDISATCRTGDGASDVRYRWTPPETRNYCIRAKSIDESTPIAPVISVWSEDCGAEIYCDAGAPTDAAPAALISETFTAGTTYVIALEHYTSSDAGLFLVEFEACAPAAE